jgi:serine/threonine protein kinase
MKKEVEALSKLDHKHIVKMYEYFPHPTSDKLVVLMEYLQGGELYHYWHRFAEKKIPEEEAKEIIKQLV